MNNFRRTKSPFYGIFQDGGEMEQQPQEQQAMMQQEQQPQEATAEQEAQAFLDAFMQLSQEAQQLVINALNQ